MKAQARASLLCLAWLVLPLWGGERLPAPVRQWLSSTPAPLVPKVQHDDFSCGYLALAAIYESYGLDAEQARLKQRLGISVPAIPFIENSNGTLQPDLFRVLQQDGFRATPIDLANDQKRRLLHRHLRGPHYALALICVPQTGGLHWVVLTHYHQESDTVTVADSLKEGLQTRPLTPFIESNLLRVILLSPGKPDPHGSYGAAHLVGSQEMWASLSLLQKLLLSLFLILFITVAFFLLRFSVRLWRKSKDRKAT